MGLLEFCVFQLEKHSEAVSHLGSDIVSQGKLLLEAGLAAMRFEKEMRDQPKHMDEAGKIRLGLTTYGKESWGLPLSLGPELQHCWDVVVLTRQHSYR